MNNVAILPELLMCCLQKQNIKREIDPSFVSENKLNKEDKDKTVDISNNEKK